MTLATFPWLLVLSAVASFTFTFWAILWLTRPKPSVGQRLVSRLKRFAERLP